MDALIAGVRTFQREVYPHSRELFEQLVTGQSPEALVITCSDSRVDPVMITQARPGQLFELRNAGNLVPRYSPHVGGVTATIEFAVVALKVPNIIVCGHSECGAMAGLLKPDLLRDMPRVAEWLKHAATVREAMSTAGQLDRPDALQRAVEANVIVQLDHLRTHPAVAEALSVGRIRLHGWVYHIATGEVTSYNADWCEFVPV
jgi:carbonic anhydrase